MNSSKDQGSQSFQLKGWQQGVIFVFAFMVFVARRPDAVFHAQFWAEDGHVWFANAYNLGWWTALFHTQDGYYQTLPRLGAALALLVPLALAPLVMNSIAIAFQVLPINILLSSRSSVWGSLRNRCLMATIYLALPNIREMDAIITSSQWVLALCVFLLLVASPPVEMIDKTWDTLLILLCGVTGPFCLFLFPIAGFQAWRNRSAWRWIPLALLGGSTLIQAWGLLVVDRVGRSHAVLGANPGLFTRLVGGQVFLATLLGANGLSALSSPGVFKLLLCSAIIGFAVIAVCFMRASMEMKLYLLLTSVLLAASFISPAAYPPPGVTRWELLTHAGGVRYWFFPSLAFAWSLLFLLRSQRRTLRAVVVVLLLVMCFGIVRDFELPAFSDLHFSEDAKRIESAPAGTAFTIPENPYGWDIRLVKRSSRDSGAFSGPASTATEAPPSIAKTSFPGDH